MKYFDSYLMPGLFQGLLLVTALFFLRKRDIHRNNVLLGLVLASTHLTCGVICYHYWGKTWAYRWDMAFGVVFLLLGPLAYTYIRRSSGLDQARFKLGWVHFLPIIVYLGIFIVKLTVWDQQALKHIYKHHWFFKHHGAAIVAAISMAIYLFLIFRFANYRRKSGLSTSFQSSPGNYIPILLVGLLFTLEVRTVLRLMKKLWQVPIPQAYAYLWVFMPLTMYLIGYVILLNPELLRQKTYTGRSRLDEQSTQAIAAALKQVMDVQRVYMDDALTLSRLAQLLGTSTHDLSWFLNEVHGMSFNEYINNYRINAFIERIEQNEHVHKTLLAISFEVGFRSKTTFNRVFKEAKGVSPSSYLKKQLKSA